MIASIVTTTGQIFARYEVRKRKEFWIKWEYHVLKYLVILRF